MPTNKELQNLVEWLVTRVARLEASNANLKSELDAIRTARSGSTWAKNTLFKSNVKPSLEMMNVVTVAKIDRDKGSGEYIRKYAGVRIVAVNSRGRGQA